MRSNITRAARMRPAPERARPPRRGDRSHPPPQAFWPRDVEAIGGAPGGRGDPLADRPIVVVRANGTIGIPRGIRNALLLDPGERVSLGFEQGVLTVRPVDACDASGTPAGGVAPLDREIDDFLRRRRRRTPT